MKAKNFGGIFSGVLRCEVWIESMDGQKTIARFKISFEYHCV